MENHIPQSEYPDKKRPKALRDISIRAFNGWMITIACILFALLLSFIIHMIVRYNAMIKASDDYIAAESDAAMLHSASDYLTEEVRLFAINMDLKHINNYFHEVNITKRREHALEELQNHSVDDDTKRSLEDALKNSNKLIQQEIYSMKLIAVANNYKKGDLPEEVQSVTLTADDAALTPEEQIKKGQLMVFDQSYQDTKQHITTQLDTFTDRILSTMRYRQEKCINSLHLSIILVIIFVSLLFIMNMITFLVITLLVVHPLKVYIHCIEDKKLFDIAKDTLKEKAASDEPFNLTMLTVDTHFEDGYVCDECDDTFGENQYANVMACSSRRVAEFVKWVQSQDFYENTTIVISGDHLTMDSDFCEDVPDTYERKVFTTYINAPVQPTDTTKYREYSTFDQFPTTLAALGVSIEGNHLGLGTNLFSSEITLIEKYDKNVVDDELEKQSDFMDEMTKNIKQVKKEETSDNDNTTEETEQTETQDQPLAEIEVTPYDYHKGYYTITVQNIVPDDVHTVRCAIWQEEDQSDLIWYEAEHESDDTYVVNSMARDFGYRPGEYQIHVYGVTDEGDPVLLGSSMGEIVK